MYVAVNIPREQILSVFSVPKDNHGRGQDGNEGRPRIYVYAKVKYLPNPASNLCSRCLSRY